MNELERSIIGELAKRLERVSRGETVPADPVDTEIPELKSMEESIGHLCGLLADARDFITAVSQGRLDVDPPPRNPLIGPFKQMHANLRHLTWQTKQIAAGDLDQQVDFLGSFSVAFNAMIDALREKRAAEEEIRYLSMHDTLTDLYNRGYFEEEMERLEKGRCFPVSILMADLDGLKKINDTQGHATGDKLIKGAAEVLKQSVRASDVVARMGGDEFAVILPGTENRSALGIIDRIRRIESTFNSGSSGYKVAFSIGVATSGPDEPLSETLKSADEMMYRDKFVRKNEIQKGGI